METRIEAIAKEHGFNLRDYEARIEAIAKEQGFDLSDYEVWLSVPYYLEIFPEGEDMIFPLTFCYHHKTEMKEFWAQVSKRKKVVFGYFSDGKTAADPQFFNFSKNNTIQDCVDLGVVFLRNSKKITQDLDPNFFCFVGIETFYEYIYGFGYEGEFFKDVCNNTIYVPNQTPQHIKKHLSDSEIKFAAAHMHDKCFEYLISQQWRHDNLCYREQYQIFLTVRGVNSTKSANDITEYVKKVLRYADLSVENIELRNVTRGFFLQPHAKNLQ
ncbi:MAG: hypothetical protein LUH82_07225 [Clostridiales bacterium]|nr:hypothetical protein [Clostridiales bacterium]